MKFVKKLLSAFIAYTLLLPCIAFAAENTQYETFYPGTEISLFNSSEKSRALSDNEKALVQDIISALRDRKSAITDIDKYEIKPSEENLSLLLKAVFYAVQYDYSELFYTDFNNSYSYRHNKNALTEITLENFYTMNSDEITEANAEISAELEKIKGLINDDMTDVEKVLIVHDYIAANYEYDTRLYNDSGEEHRTLDKFVTEKTGVCQAYSALFKYVMDNINIECTNVLSDECKHEWNKVKIDADGDGETEWYNIDITSDDPLMDMASSISHTYFLVNDNEIKQADLDNSINLHTTWNAYKWDNQTPVEVSDSEYFSKSIIHEIPGQMVYKDGKWYGFTNLKSDSEDTHNVLCTIDANANTITPVYTDSSDFIWYVHGSTNTYYKANSSLVLYNGNIYFNSPDKVYKYDTTTNSAEAIYDFAEENPDKKDDSNTYLYGIRVRDNALFIEYTTQPYTIQNEQGDIVSAKMDDIIQIMPKALPCSSAQSFNKGTGEVTVTLSIPDNIESPKVLAAQFDENGILIGFAEHEQNSDTITFTPDAACKTVKTFIWDSENNSPLSDVTPLTIAVSSDKNDQ